MGIFSKRFKARQLQQFLRIFVCSTKQQQRKLWMTQKILQWYPPVHPCCSLHGLATQHSFSMECNSLSTSPLAQSLICSSMVHFCHNGFSKTQILSSQINYSILPCLLDKIQPSQLAQIIIALPSLQTHLLALHLSTLLTKSQFCASCGSDTTHFILYSPA